MLPISLVNFPLPLSGCMQPHLYPAHLLFSSPPPHPFRDLRHLLAGLVHKALSPLPVAKAGGAGDGLFGFARAPSVLDVLMGVGGKKVLEERREAVARLEEGMLCVGTVSHRLPHGLQIRLERVAKWSSRDGAAVTPRLDRCVPAP
jgi:hypothetical protein